MIIQGNVLHIPLRDNSVQCVVTSPPYYGLRDYSVEGQLGLEPTLEEYIQNTVMWAREVWRVLKDDGVFWLNIGDSYVGSANSGGASTIQDGTNKSMRLESLPTKSGKPKDLMLVPHRVAIALQNDGAESPRTMQVVGRLINAISSSYDSIDQWPDKIRQEVERLEKEWEDAHSGGWWVRSDIVWNKPNPMPESVTDRPTKAHEYIFLLSKNKKYFYDADAIREGQTTPLDTKAHQTFGAPGGKAEIAYGQKVSGDKWIPSGYRNKRSVWTITTKPYPGSHFATFPPELPETCIKAGTSEKGECPECGKAWVRVVEASGGTIGKSWHSHENDIEKGMSQYSGLSGGVGNAKNKDGIKYKRQTLGWKPQCDHGHDPVPQIVLDPFSGSGTTVMVANALGRKGIGLDLSWDYIQLAKDRTGMRALEEWQNGKKVEANLEGLPMFSTPTE